MDVQEHIKEEKNHQIHSIITETNGLVFLIMFNLSFFGLTLESMTLLPENIISDSLTHVQLSFLAELTKNVQPIFFT